MELQRQNYLVLKDFLAGGHPWKRNDVIEGPDWGPVRLTQLVDQRYIAPLVSKDEKIDAAGLPPELAQKIESMAAELVSLRERVEEIASRKRGRPRKSAAA